MTQQDTPFTRTCARTGEEREGKFYVLKTTEGEELVSEEAFWGGRPDGEGPRKRPHRDGKSGTGTGPGAE